ncbi:MAG: TonB-dependent receptor, partial [Chitinophagaceae bacterium]
QYYGEGIPTARNSGVHYDTKWNDGKQSINANYKLGSLRVEGLKNTLNQNNLPTGLINSNSDNITNNYLFRQNVDAIYSIKLDTTSNLKVTINGSFRENETENNYLTISKREDNSLINTSSRLLSNNGNDNSFNATAFYTKQLKKKGRTFSLNVYQSLNNSDIEGFLNSKNDFYTTTGTLNRSEIIDQFKTSVTANSSSSAKASYTEPINDKLTLIFNYAIGLNSSDAEKKSFNASAPGRYDVLDTKFSNHFEVDQISNSGGASFNYRLKKSSWFGGTQVNNVSYHQEDALSNTTYNRNFLNWIPNASYQYRISSQRSFRVSYNGRTTQPSVSQLQPILNNNDPLNIPLGNPDLKPSYNNRFSVNYNSYKVLTSQEIWINGSYGFTSNSIVSNRITDPTTGATISQSINLTDKMPTNYNLWTNFGRKFKFIDMNVGLSLNTSGGTSYNYINNVISKNKRHSYDFNFNLSKSKEKKYEVYAYFGPTYSVQESSIQQAVNNNGWGFNGNASFKIFLPGKLEIASELQYERAAGTVSFGVPLEKSVLNSSISKKFLKTENLRMTLSANDLFNQNIGFSRYNNENMLTQTSYLTIKRYFMYSITWDFNKMGGGLKK